MDVTTAGTPHWSHDFTRRLFAIIDGRRWNELGRVFAADCVYHRPGYPALVGLADIERFYREERIIESGSHRVEEVMAGDDSLACWGSFQGLSRAGERLDERFSDHYRIDDGLISARRTYFYRAAI
ncbi:nuclear transport factor 2 family protein [Streptomyces sp. NPDC059071]|uniref:nuclear transport factor 2 family protein n=1 Tax=unclassified Streptomyces TaxID=2593676 RepID=UPI00363F09FE